VEERGGGGKRRTKVTHYLIQVREGEKIEEGEKGEKGGGGSQPSIFLFS